MVWYPCNMWSTGLLLLVKYVSMCIEPVPNRNSPPAILLQESFRESKRVRKSTLANLSKWPPRLIDGLRVLLKGGVAVADPAVAFEIDCAFFTSRTCPCHAGVSQELGPAPAAGLPPQLRAGPGGGSDRDPHYRSPLQTRHR